MLANLPLEKELRLGRAPRLLQVTTVLKACTQRAEGQPRAKA